MPADKAGEPGALYDQKPSARQTEKKPSVLGCEVTMKDSKALSKPPVAGGSTKSGYHKKKGSGAKHGYLTPPQKRLGGLKKVSTNAAAAAEETQGRVRREGGKKRQTRRLGGSTRAEKCGAEGGEPKRGELFYKYGRGLSNKRQCLKKNQNCNGSDYLTWGLRKQALSNQEEVDGKGTSKANSVEV